MNSTTVNVSFENMIFKMEKDAPQDFWNLDWTCISGFKILSEEFMYRYRERLNWKVICSSQPLTLAFIKTMKNHIVIKVLVNTNKNLSLDFLYENGAEIHKNIKEKLINSISILSETYSETLGVIHLRRSQGFLDDFVTSKPLTRVRCN